MPPIGGDGSNPNDEDEEEARDIEREVMFPICWELLGCQCGAAELNMCGGHSGRALLGTT